MIDLLQRGSYYLGFAFCHQIPEKTLVAFDKPVSLCARDQGIYLGFFIMLLFFGAKTLKKKAPFEIPPLKVSFLLLAIALLMPLDAVFQAAGLYFSNMTRVFSGLAFAFGMTPFVLVISSDGFLVKGEKKLLFRSKKLFFSLLVILACGFLFFFENDAYILLTSILAIIGFLILFLILNFIVLAFVFKKRFLSSWARTRIYFIFVSVVFLSLEILFLRYLHSLFL